MNMNTKKTGYPVKKFDFPTKRYCQTLDLKDDPELIAEYIARHSEAKHWPKINEGIRVCPRFHAKRNGKSICQSFS
jgi:L-rhamnose mutarotase